MPMSVPRQRKVVPQENYNTNNLRFIRRRPSPTTTTYHIITVGDSCSTLNHDHVLFSEELIRFDPSLDSTRPYLKKFNAIIDEERGPRHRCSTVHQDPDVAIKQLEEDLGHKLSLSLKSKLKTIFVGHLFFDREGSDFNNCGYGAAAAKFSAQNKKRKLKPQDIDLGC